MFRHSISYVFDYDATLQRMGRDMQLFREMVGLFLEEAPISLERILRGMERRDAASVRSHARALKGLAANFSAARAVQIADRFEKFAVDDAWIAMTAAFDDLQTAFDELIGALKPWSERQ